MIPRKPYLLRAMVEWAEDNGWTPLVAVDAEQEGVRVPMAYVEDGRITLNVSFSALNQRHMDNEALSGQARFGGKAEIIYVPMAAVAALVVRETGEGMVFPEEAELDADASAEASPADASPLRAVDGPSDPASDHAQAGDDGGDEPEPPRPPRGKPSLKVVK